MLRNCLIAACLCVASLSAAGIASAAGPAYLPSDCGAWNYGYGRGIAGYGGYAYLAPRISFVPTPPYFALHPPVYYSAQIYRRPYGWSPYAFNGQTMPSEAVVVSHAARAEPQLIVNPFVAQK
jgi:hypothetical protein